MGGVGDVVRVCVCVCEHVAYVYQSYRICRTSRFIIIHMCNRVNVNGNVAQKRANLIEPVSQTRQLLDLFLEMARSIQQLGRSFVKYLDPTIFFTICFDIETKGFVTFQASIGPRQLQNAVLYLASLWFCRTNSSKTCSFGTVERFVVALNPFYYVTLAGMGYSIEYDVATIKNFSRSRSTYRYCLY